MKTYVKGSHVQKSYELDRAWMASLGMSAAKSARTGEAIVGSVLHHRLLTKQQHALNSSQNPLPLCSLG